MWCSIIASMRGKSFVDVPARVVVACTPSALLAWASSGAMSSSTIIAALSLEPSPAAPSCCFLADGDVQSPNHPPKLFRLPGCDAGGDGSKSPRAIAGAVLLRAVSSSISAPACLKNLVEMPSLDNREEMLPRVRCRRGSAASVPSSIFPLGQGTLSCVIGCSSLMGESRLFCECYCAAQQREIDRVRARGAIFGSLASCDSVEISVRSVRSEKRQEIGNQY